MKIKLKNNNKMKPNQDLSESEPLTSESVTGDVIGDTAYSERFVLKILLKLANTNSLKEDIKEKSFEDDLCTLWDMTAERDVVLFLEKHEVLSLFNFALPILDSPRIVEIVIGVIGNMCCQKEIVQSLLKMEGFLINLLENIASDDSLVLIQVLRMVNSCLFLTEENCISTWLDLFQKVAYSNSLYFMLKNSSHKDLLITALENLNTICTYCNTTQTRSIFFTQFLSKEALESLTSALTEIVVTHKDSCSKDELERTLVITLQIILNIIGFDKSLEIYKDDKDGIINVISQILKYYENKLVNDSEVEADLVDVIDSTATITNTFDLTVHCKPEDYFISSYNIWKASQLIMKSDDKNVNNFEEDDKKELQDFVNQTKTPLSKLLCTYMAKCSDSNLFAVLDLMGNDFEEVMDSLSDKDISDAVLKRARNYRTRLKENIDS